MLRLAFLAALALAAPLQAADPATYDVQLAAPAQARAYALVSVDVELPAALSASLFHATLTDTETKKAGPAVEITELPLRPIDDNAKTRTYRAVFRAENLAAGEKRSYRLTVDADRRRPLPTERFAATVRSNEGVTTVSYKQGEKSVRVAQMIEPTLDESSKETRTASYKPYVHLFDPETGEVELTNGAEGKYPHHRGIFYGFNKITYGTKAADCWHCTGDAHQAWRKSTATAQGSLLLTFCSEIDWCGPGKEAFARELRSQSFYHLPGGTLFEFASLLTPLVDEPVRLDGDPQHAGFHFRAAQEVEAKHAKETYFLKPTGKGEPGTEENWDPKTKKGPVNLPWEVMSFVAGGKRYSVLYIDSTDNPKESRHSERTYGRLGNYFEFTATRDKPLEVHYRLWLQEGELTKEQCEALALDFASPVKATAKPVKE